MGRPVFLRIHAWIPQVASTSTPILPKLIELLDLALWMYGELPDGMALVSLSHLLPSGPGYNSLTLIGSSGAAYLLREDRKGYELPKI